METMKIYKAFKKFGSGARETESAETGLECEAGKWGSLECV